MTQHWRGDPDEETGMGRFFRHRWEPDSVYVLDVDHLICHPSGRVGILIEEKHATSTDRKARITRALASAKGWWSALFVYETTDGTPRGSVTHIDAIFWDPNGRPESREDMDFEWFDEWVCSNIGARMRKEIAA